jgi:RHS repeat-associated protein
VAGSDTADIRAQVQKWVNGQAANHGLQVKAASETIPASGDQSVGYVTDDFYHGGGWQPPSVTIEYADGSKASGPAVAITEPANGAGVSGPAVPFKASVGDDSKVTKVEFLSNGTLLATDTDAPYETTFDSGPDRFATRQLTVRASDDAGNVTTSAPVSAHVDNGFPPWAEVITPTNNGQVSGTTRVTALTNYTAERVEFLLDGEVVGEVVGGVCAPNCEDRYFHLDWNTKHPLRPVANGSHTLTARVFETGYMIPRSFDSAPITITVQNDAADQYEVRLELNDPVNTADDVVPEMVGENLTAGVPVQDPYSGTIDPATGLSGGSLNKSLATPPVAGAPGPLRTATTCPAQAYCPSVWIKNDSARSWDGSKVKLWYRWFSDNGAVLLEAPSDAPLPSTFAAGQAHSVPVTVHPPKLPPGAELGRYHLRLDLYDEGTQTWFSAAGRKPVDNPVVVAKTLNDRLGLERFWQYDAEDIGAGMSSLTNVANGNMLLRWSPFFAPGRGLGTTADLTYNALEDHSRSPVGNNFSLSMSGLIRFGEPLDIHPNKADQISGQANKWVEFVDGDGTLHRFTGTTGLDGITRWAEPPGVNLYLRSIAANAPDRRWALTRPDNVTFYFDEDGFPTAIVDRNGNTISYLLENTPPGEDPGGPKKRIIRVTDAGGRSFTIDYFSKDEVKKAHVRGKVQRILDHSGSVLDFEYYNDGNLLRLIQRGGTKATGEPLADRTFVFTYTTSNGAGPAIPDRAARNNPDPRTPNQSTRIFSVRDPRGAETTYDYYIPSEVPQQRWMLQSRTNRLGHTTSFSYDLTQRITTVNPPLSRTTQYGYDTDGKVTRIVNPLNQATAVEWSADFKVTKVTEPTGRFTTYGYNANGYLTARTDQLGNRTELTYLDQQVDPNDTARHLSLLATVTRPRGVATPTVGDFQWKFGYDAAGNLDLVTDPTGAVTNYDYNGPGTANPGTLAATHDANGNPPTTFPVYDPSGQPAEIRDPMGNVTRVGYDVDGLVRWIQDANHGAYTGSDERSYRSYFDYDAFHRLGRQSAPKSTQHDRGRLIWSSSDYDANDNGTRRVDPHYGSASSSGATGPAWTTVYDAMDRPTEIANPDTSVDPRGERTALGYDAAGRLVKQTKPKGVLSPTVDDFTTIYGYDPLDRVIKQTAFGTSTAEARHTHLCYDIAGDLRSVTSPRAGLASVSCPGDGPLTGVGFTTSYSYDAAHQRVAVRDPLGHEARTGYDANGNVTAKEQDIAAGRLARTAVDYDPRDRPNRISERFDGVTNRNAVTGISYDRNGNTSRVVSPRGRDTAGTGTPTFYLTDYGYDATNRLTRISLPFDGRDGTERQYVHRSYDANGNLAWTSLPVTSANAVDVRDSARTRLTVFDPGWIRTSDDPANPAVHFDYAAAGWQTLRVPERRDSPGQRDEAQVTTWSHHADGLLASRTDQGGQSARYHYDANNNLTSATDSAGLTDPAEKAVETTAAYTGFDEAAKARHRKTGEPTWKFGRYTYDDDGNVIVREDNGEEDNNGLQTKAPRRYELSYDGANWLTQQLDLGTDGGCAGDQRIVNAFWGTGWEKQRDTYRAGTGCTADPGTWPKKQTTTWNHFDNGKLRDLTTVNGAGEVLESHQVGYLDPAGVYVNGNRTTDRYVLKRAEGNTASTCVAGAPCDAVYEYDARDRLIRHQQRAGKTVSYRFDEPANLLGDQTVRAGSLTTEVDAQTIVRKYTGTQLTDATIGSATARYWYDPLGNLDCVTTGAGSQADCSPSDGGGVSANLVSDFGYDYLNRLAALRQYSAGTRTDIATYTYDALDRTVKESEDHAGTGNDRTTTFTYQNLTSLVTAEAQVGGTDPQTKTYSYDAYGHRLTMTTAGPTGAATPYSFGYDVHGSVSQLIDDAGKVKASYGYTAYGGTDSALTTGDTVAQAPLNPFRYSGRRMDSGTAPSTAPGVPSGGNGYDMGARRYGPDLSGFYQADMFGDALADLGLALDPLTQNRYALAGGNPISNVEVDGHMLMANGGGGGSSSPSPPPPPPPSQQSDSGDGGGFLGGVKRFGSTVWKDGSEAVKGALDLYDTLDRCGMEGDQGACDQLEQQFATKEGWKNTWKSVSEPFKRDCASTATAPECAAHVTVAAAELLIGGKGATKTSRALRPDEPVDQPDGSRPGAPCAPNSFTPDTPVLMADGTRKAIKDVRVGDMVLATDPVTGRTEARRVTRLITGNGTKNLVRIVVDTDGARGDATAVVTATGHHPFWVDGQGRWIDAAELRPGQRLRSTDGTASTVLAVQPYTAVQTVHNLTVSGIHTYYVAAGDTSLLVHNCGGPVRVSPAAQDWGTKGAHVHVGNHEVRIFPDGRGGIGAEPIRLRSGSATQNDVQKALNEIHSSPQFRSALAQQARSAMDSMNRGEWGMSTNRAAEMHFLIKALEGM